MKTKTFFFISVLIIGIFSIMNYAKGAGYCELYYFETDEDIYYTDEIIKINASWDLFYGLGDTTFIQIKIFNESNDVVWVSPQHSEKGPSNNIWTVDIKELNTSFENRDSILYVKFFYWDPDGPPEGDFLEPIIQIITIKRNTSLELVECPKYINYGDDLQFTAVFYNISQDNKSYLVNWKIFFRIVSEGIITYNNSYITNSSGKIMIKVASINLTLGSNILIFEIDVNKFYDNLVYEHTLYVKSDTIRDKNSEGDGSKGDNSIIFSVVSIISILSISILALYIIFYSYMKRTKPKNLLDLTFKY